MKRNKLEQVIELCKQGLTPAMIIKKTGMSKSYVYNVRSKHKAEIQAKPKAKAKTIVLSQSELRLAASLAKARNEPPLSFKVATPISFTPTKSLDDMVNSPSHYTKGGIETIDFIEAKELNYHLGNVVAYIVRSDHKGSKLQDLEKAQWYLNREINNLKK